MSRTAGSTIGGARIEELRARVDATLRRFLADRRARLAPEGPVATELIDELARVLDAGGKRLRPLFCYWGFRSGGGADSDRIVAVAAALELLHTFAIIHDDVMDRSPLRRGRPASHVALAHGGDEHRGVSAAILAGDFAFVLADELFFEAGFPEAAFTGGFRRFNAMRTEVMAGQYLDLAAATGGAATEETVRRIARLKSGGYSVEKPLLIGAALAGAAQSIETGLSSYGVSLGEAFQLRDDVLGAFGDPVVTGKDAHGDLREGKQTFLVARALAAAGPAERAFLEAHLGRRDLADEDAERIRELFRSTGALAATLTAIEELREAALRALREVVLPPDAAAALTELAVLATARES